MGDLQATVEFLVELHKFYNVDLFIRGNYQFRLTFKPPKCAHAIQVETCDYRDKAGAFTLFPAFITEDGQTAVSRTFNIYYKDEEVILKDVFLFRVHLLIDSTKAADCIDKTVLELNVDVHFTEQILRKENYKSLPMVTSRTLQFHMSCFDGLHHQVPLLFDYYYFSIVDVVFHATIVSLGLPNWRILKPVKSGWFAKSNPQRTPSPIFFNTLFGNRQLNTQFYSDTALKYAMPTSTMTRESFEKASGMHRNLCAILAMAHYQLLNYFEEMMKHVDNKQKISLGSKLDPAELVDGLCKKLETLQSCEEAFDEICSDLSVLTNELALLWLQFQESFALNDKIRSILQEQHHQERMKHFSEAFFLHQLSWSSLVQPSDGSAQKHTAMGQCVKNSRYLSLIPPVTVECAEVDGDPTTTPIFFEDRYVSGNDVKIDKQALNVTQPVTTLVEDEVLEHKPLSFGILNEAFRDGSPTKGHRDSEEWVDITMEDSQANVVVEDDHKGACQDLQDAGIVSGTGNCVTDGTTVAGNSGEDPIKDVLPDILCAEASNVDGMGDLNSGSTANKDIVMPCTMADQETDHLTACVANDVRITTPFSAGTSQISVSEETNNHKGDQNGTTAGNPPCVMVGSKESADNTHSTNSKSTNLSPELTPVSTCVESDNESGTNSCLVAKQTLENPNGEDDECCIMALTISDSKEIEETAKTSDSQATQKSSEISETNEVNQSDSNFAKNEQKKENYVVACAKEVDDVPEIAVAVGVTDATSIVTEVKSKDVATDSGFPTKEQLINSEGDGSGQSAPSSAGNDIGSAGEDGSENTKVVPCSLVANDEEPATVTMVENIVEPDSTTIVAAEVVQLSSEDGRPSSAKDVDLDSPPSGTKEFEKCQNLGPDSEENPSGLKPVIAAEEATTGEKQIVSSTKTVKVTYIPEAEPEKPSDRSYTLERKIDNSVFYDRSGACQLPPIRGKTGTQWFDEIDGQRVVNVPHPAKTVEKPTTCFCGDNTDKGASPYKSNKEIEKRNIKLDRAKQEVKSRMNYCGTLYSDLDLEPLVRPYFMDNKPDLSSAPVHFVICVHGLDGNSGDLRLLRCFLEMALPSTKFEFLMSEINQDNTFLPFHDLTEKLVSEILHHMEAYRVTPTRISFIGHSLGNIIIRSALTHPLMEPYINMFHTFLSLSGPHLGMIYHTSSLVSTGLWLMQKWKKSASLSELSLNDSQDLRETFLYKLSQKKGLEYFTNVLLVSSVQDHYVPFHSSRIEMPKSLLRGNSQECAVYREMMDNILQPLLSQPNRTLVRYSVYHCLPSSTNTFIGRAAHIAMLDSELFIEKLICRSAAKYFK